jgi:predicted amino acid dehydrogenase
VDTFAFIIHPIDPKRDVGRKFPFLGKLLTKGQIDYFSAFFPPVSLSEIEGIVSTSTIKRIKGWLIACPLTPSRMFELPKKRVYRKIIETGRIAEKLGAQILGLGAFTSVVGDAGLTVARTLDIPVTTGDSYTVSIAVKTLEVAAKKMEISLRDASAAVVGATGAIGRICAELLAEKVAELYLIARRPERIQELRARLQDRNVRVRLHTSTDLSVLPQARLILTVTSDQNAIIQPEHLKAGSLLCDLARPRDVSYEVAESRDDVLVIDGGMVDLPGEVNFNFDFGLPPGKAYACMAETVTLALEGYFEDYSLGKEIKRDQVEEITAMADKHGLKMSSFRSFGRVVTDEQMDIIKQRARITRRHT